MGDGNSQRAVVALELDTNEREKSGMIHGVLKLIKCFLSSTESSAGEF